MITALIIDDEKGSRKSLANLINKYCEDVQLIGKADGVESGITIVKKLRPELIFLDIRMRDGTGFQLLERLNERTFQVVFTTAYDEYAIRAFRFSAIDYLLKPINLEELQAAVSKAIINSKSLSQSELKPIIDRLLKFNHEDPTITVSTESSVEFIKVSDIVHLKQVLLIQPYICVQALKCYRAKPSEFLKTCCLIFIFLDAIRAIWSVCQTWCASFVEMAVNWK